MLSTALAGILRAGAVVLTAGALGGGVYFLVQAGDSQDDAMRLQAPTRPTATVEAPRDLSPPGDLSGPAEVKAPPTPTFPPAPIPDPGIDTSDWKTYVSPLGFTLKYPPGWEVFVGETGTVKIENEVRQAGRAQWMAGGPSEGVSLGDAWIEIVPDAFPRFDTAELFEICQPSRPLPEGATNAVSQVTLAGSPAVRCVGGGLAPGGQHRIAGEGYYIELPPGHVMHVTMYAVEGETSQGDEMTLGILRKSLASLSFEAAP